MRFLLLIVLLLPLMAQTQAPPTIAGQAKTVTSSTFDLLVRAAEKMPEDQFGFKPTPEVRSFGQLVGHVADSGNMFCSLVGGKPNPNAQVEKTKTTKADLVAAIKEVKEFCTAAVADLSESKMVDRRGTQVPAVVVVMGMTGHNWEHYGNMVTYLRMKGIVPPSSEPRR